MAPLTWRTPRCCESSTGNSFNTVLSNLRASRGAMLLRWIKDWMVRVSKKLQGLGEQGLE